MENLINTDIFSVDLKRALSMALPQPEGLEMAIITKKLDANIIDAKTSIPSSGKKIIIPTWKVVGIVMLVGFAAFVVIKLCDKPKQKETKIERPATEEATIIKANDDEEVPEVIEVKKTIDDLFYP